MREARAEVRRGGRAGKNSICLGKAADDLLFVLLLNRCRSTTNENSFSLSLSHPLKKRQDSKTVCLDGNEPAPYLLYSSSSSGADPSAGAFLGAACPAPLMLLATTTTAATTAKAKAAKKNKSSPKLSWSRALAPSGSAAFLHVDWVGAEEVFEEQQSGGQEPVWTFAAPAFAAGAAVAAAATLLLLPKEGRSPTENDGKGEDDHKGAEDRKRQETQKREEAEARWARDGGGAGRLSKVRAAADAAGGDGAG